MSIATAIHWKGFSEIRHLVIFGDSYSAVGYDSSQAHPSKELPLGVLFPGGTWSEYNVEEKRFEPNWVGFLITEFVPGQEILVYDYAVGGDTVEGVVQQIQRHFFISVGPKPEWAAWSANDSLFVTWIGINDLGTRSSEAWIRGQLEKLFIQQAALYETGARNFLFIDVPPVHRSPVGNHGHSKVIELWNTLLADHTASFASERKDVTVMIFSSFGSFSRILDDPVKFGFSEGDVRKHGGSIWVDHIHPSSKVHSIVARDIAEFSAWSTPFLRSQRCARVESTSGIVFENSDSEAIPLRSGSIPQTTITPVLSRRASAEERRKDVSNATYSSKTC